LQTAFARASDALAAAVAAQTAAESPRPAETVPLSSPTGSGTAADGATLRIALHTAEVAPDKQARHSPALQHATRLLLAAHPGQILVSEKSAVLLRDDLEAGVHLLDLGRYRLREDAPPEPLLQVCYPDMAAREVPPPDGL